MTRREHYLYPGMLCAEPEPHRITTVLGSCVSVCLFDPVRHIGGINHYMLPLWNGEGLSTPRYGNVAIDALIDRLLGFGCLVTRLQAKLFGGAAMWDNANRFMPVGAGNIDLAWRILKQYGIPVVANDLGGSASRKIIFCSDTGDVFLRRQTSVALSEAQSGKGGTAAVPTAIRTP